MNQELNQLRQAKAHMDKVAQQIINIHSHAPNAISPEEDKELRNHMLNIGEQYAAAVQRQKEADQAYDDALALKTMPGGQKLLGVLGGGALGAGLGAHLGGLAGGLPELRALGAVYGGLGGLVAGGLTMGAIDRKQHPEVFAARNKALADSYAAEDNLNEVESRAYDAAALNPEMWQRQRVLSGISGMPAYNDLYKGYSPEYKEMLAKQRQEEMEAAAAAKLEADAARKSKEEKKDTGSDKEASFAADVEYFTKTASWLEVITA